MSKQRKSVSFYGLLYRALKSDSDKDMTIRYEDFIDWNKPKGQFYKPYGEDYNRMIRRLMRDRIIEDCKARIKWQNKLLRKDGYTGPELGMGIYK